MADRTGNTPGEIGGSVEGIGTQTGDRTADDRFRPPSAFFSPYPAGETDVRLILTRQELLLAALMPFSKLPASSAETSYGPETRTGLDKEI
ncbi:hypothetical protein [Streptomyces sp. NPDC006668]|uniref:hypothetical protein n=1 Tax=Streptomyces sp. NPDC006668 TaxID=3156903 RepID=UPI0034041C2E